MRVDDPAAFSGWHVGESDGDIVECSQVPLGCQGWRQQAPCPRGDAGCDFQRKQADEADNQAQQRVFRTKLQIAQEMCPRFELFVHGDRRHLDADGGRVGTVRINSLSIPLTGICGFAGSFRGCRGTVFGQKLRALKGGDVSEAVRVSKGRSVADVPALPIASWRARRRPAADRAPSKSV